MYKNVGRNTGVFVDVFQTTDKFTLVAWGCGSPVLERRTVNQEVLALNPSGAGLSPGGRQDISHTVLAAMWNV